LALEIGQTTSHLSRSGVAVLGGTTLQDVADIDVVAGQAHAFGEDVVEELSGPSDKGQALLVLIITGGLADEDQPSVGVALAKDHVGAGLGEGALLAILHLGLEGLEGLAFLLGSGLGEIGGGWGLRDFVGIEGDGLGAEEEVGLELLKTGPVKIAGRFRTHSLMILAMEASSKYN